MAAPEQLFCWEGDFGLPSVTTDCLTVLAYVQFAGAPLKVHKISNPWKSPSGQTEAGQIKNVFCVLQKYNADYDLSAKEGADSLAFISLLEEKLLPALVNLLVVVDGKNFVDVTRRWFAEHLPFPLSLVLPGRMQRRESERLRLAVFSLDLNIVRVELLRDAAECMNLLSQRLGQSQFFFGDSPSSLDAFVFGHLAPVLKIKLPNGKLQQHLQTLDNLCGFCSNILQLYFPRNSAGTGHAHTTTPTQATPTHRPRPKHPANNTPQDKSVRVQQGALEEPPDEEPETHEREHEQ
uniref:Metaxin-1 n=1 Tax=Neogobius melanostomus TaxID=47308 RepID=A0A8C6WVZ0_9GOBI